MGSALEAVLRLRDQEAAANQQRTDNLNKTLEMFQQARQQAQANKLAELQMKAGLAEKGLIIDTSSPNGFRRDNSLQDPNAQLLTLSKNAEAARNLNLPGAYRAIQKQAASLSGTPVGDVIQNVPQTTNNPDDIINQKDDFGEYTPQAKTAQAVEQKKKLNALEPPTQGESTTALYAERMQQANHVFDNIEKFTNNLNFGDMVQGGLPEFANFLKSEDMQAYQQAQKNFLNAVLRKESGAVINPSEFKEGRQQYFPQQGDKPAVLEQKKANRQLAMDSLIKASGKAYVPPSDIPRAFNSIEDAEGANLPKGTIITINGRKARID